MDPAPDPAQLSGVNLVFLLACKNNKDIKDWIKGGADPKCIDPKTGCNGLHYACRNGNVERIKYFLACGLGINAQDHTGKTPLHYANENNNLESIGLLICNGADGQIKDHDGKVPRQLSSLLQKLDQRELDRELIIICKQKYSFAIFEKRVNEALLKGASINAQEAGFERQTRGFTPLLYACIDGDIERVKFLIEKGADVNKKSNLGVFPLYVLFSALVGGPDGSKRLEIAKILLENGADITLKGPKNHGLFAITVASEDIECMRLFKERGVDMHCVNDLLQNALSEAVSSGNGRLDIVCQLFEWGCKPVCDVEGFSLLHYAVYHNNIEIARYLIAEKGFNVNDCTNDQQTSLHLACETADLDMIKLVLEAGAKVDARDKDKKTPSQLLEKNQFLKGQLKYASSLLQRAQKAQKDNQQKRVTASSSIAQGEQEKTAEKTVTDKKQNKKNKSKNNQKKKNKKKTNPEIEKKEKVVEEKPQKIVTEKSQIRSQEELSEVVGIQDSVETEVPVIEEKKEINKKTKEKSKDKKSLVGKIAKKLDEAKTALDVVKYHISGNQAELVESKKDVDTMRSFAQVAASSQVMQQHFTMPKKEEITIEDDYLRVTTQVVWGSRPMLMPSLDNNLVNVPWSKHVIRKSIKPDDFFHNFSPKVEQDLGAFAQKKILSDGATQYIIPAKVETPYGNQYEGNFEYVEQDGKLRHRWFNAQNNKSLLALTDK